MQGSLNPEVSFVFDFVVLKKLMKGLCDKIDHKVLLPLENLIQVVEVAEPVGCKPRCVFPRVDCSLLPVLNTTVEMLAELLTHRLRTKLNAMGGRNLTAIEMEAEEDFGQSTVCRVTLQ